jgi:RHS repeat-associated protein
MTNGIAAARGAGRGDFASLKWVRNGLALLFAASLSLTTVAPAFAVTSSSAAPALAGLPAAPAPALESSGAGAANVSPYDVNNAGAGLMSLMSGGDEPKSAKFEPPETPYNGAFTRSLPVDVPPFFEITPRIALNYNSGDNRQHARDGFSILGVGWTMSGGGLIQRKSSRGGLPRFDATDAFELDGNTLMDCVVEGVTRSTPSCSAGGTHTGRYETYERIKRNSTLNSWEVTARDGVVSVYKALASFAPAGTEDARLRNDYRWLLQSITDTDGNTVSYSYDCAALPTCYVSTISYGTSSIQFYWEDRGDTFTYATGISLGNATKRLKTIAVRTGTSLIRAYKLDYTKSQSTMRSLLSSFRQYGSDATVTDGVISGGTSFPSDTFEYWGENDRRMGTIISDLATPNANPETVPSATATEPAFPTLPASTSAMNYVVGDFDGNGRTDYLEITRSNCQTKIRYNGLGTAIAVTSSAPGGWCNNAPAYYTVSDFNGDGRSDIAVRRTISQIAGTKPAELAGFGNSDTAIYTVYFVGGAIASHSVKGVLAADVGQSVQIGDFNGDGLTDLLLKKVLISTGTGFNTQTWGNAGDGAVGDFNGDGLSDFAVVKGNGGISSQFFISNGAGFTTYAASLSLDSNYPSSGDPTIVGRIGDLNGDGASDIVYARQSGDGLYVIESTGYGIKQSLHDMAFRPIGAIELHGDGRFEVDAEGKNARVRRGESNFHNSAGNLYLSNGIVSDFNGDGNPDRDHAPVRYPDTMVPDFMSRHELAAGGDIDVEYLPSTYWANGYMPFVVQAVSKIITSDGRGNSSATKYAYEGGAYDPFERKFLGFAKVTAELPCEVGETTCPWMHSWYRQEAVAAGSLSKSEVYAPNGQILRKLENGYVVNQATAPFTAHKTSEEVTDYLVGGDTVTRKEWTYDGYANLLEEKDLGVVGSIADDVITQSSYQLNLTNYLVSFATAVTVRDANSTVLRDAQLYYDGASSAATAPMKGHLTTTRNWLNPGNRWIAATSSYDSYGNLVARVDALGNRTEIDYDATHQYATEARNPLWFDGDTRQKTSMAWNAVCGAPSSSTDLNGLVTTYQYDALCRPSRTDYPSTDYVTTTYYRIGTATAQYVETARKPADGVNPIWSRTYFDGIGRTYKSTSVGADPLKPVVADTEYAKRGQPLRTTAPYYQGDSPQWTAIKADVLGRPTLVTLPDSNTVSYAYEKPGAANAATIVAQTDPLGRVTRATLDAAGRTFRHWRYMGSTGYATEYRYNPLGELVGVTDPNGNVWSNSYDTLGRRLSSSDPDLGTWTYAYDDLGRPSTQLDAKGQQTIISYDRLGRVLTRTAGYGLPIEDTTTNTYDQARSGYFNVGALTTAANANATITYDFDNGGRNVQQKTTVDGLTHTVASSFDAGGRLLSRTYPDGSGSGTFGYNAAGQMTTLSGAITGTTYAADGQVTTTTYANGVATTYGYSSTRGWLSSISAVNGTTTIESLTYGRDAAGRITSVAGGRPDESWTYGYDAFDQLLSAANTNTPSLSRTYTYDVGGNLTSNSAIGTYSYPTQGATAYQPHAVMSAGNWTFGYDLNGNQTTRHTGATLDREITYDADNRPIAVTVGGNTVAYLYGPDGARIKKLFGADATLYLGDEIERDPTGAFTNYLTGDVKRVGGANHFLQIDHQASIRSVTDNAGTLYRASAFEPFGKQIETVLNPLTPTESKGYIGERTDPENGLTYLHARYYDTSLGRFLQADWWDVRKPGVGTNRYAYALNSPINLSDPGGNCSLLQDSCSEPRPPGVITLPDGRKVDPKFLEETGQTPQSYAVSLGLKAYKAENGITGGITAGQLNASLSSTALTPTKANYLGAMLVSGTLSPTQAHEVWSVLHPPSTPVAGSRADTPAAGSIGASLLAPMPLGRCFTDAVTCSMMGLPFRPISGAERARVAAGYGYWNVPVKVTFGTIDAGGAYVGMRPSTSDYPFLIEPPRKSGWALLFDLFSEMF